MIPSTQFSGDSKNISLQLEVDDGAESVDDDSSTDSCHDPASEEEDDTKQEPEFMDCTPQNGDSTYQKGDNLFPLSTSEWTDSGGYHLSQATPVVKQEPTDSGEYWSSVAQSVETTQTKTASYDYAQLSTYCAVSHPVMSDTKVGIVKQELADNGEYENYVMQSVETTQSKTVYHCTKRTSSVATSHPIMSDTKQEPTDKGEYENSATKSEATSERTVSHHHSSLVSSAVPASLSVISSNIVTSPGAPASLSVMSSNIVTSSGVPTLQSRTGPQSAFSIIPGVSEAQIPCSAVQNPAVIGAPTLLPVTPGLAQTINLATSGNVVPPQVLNVIRRGNSLILESVSASPSTVTPNLLNPLSTFAHPVGLDLQSDSNLPPTIPLAANIVSNVGQGGSVHIQPMLVPASGVELSSRGQQVSMSSEAYSVPNPNTALTSSESPSVSHPVALNLLSRGQQISTSSEFPSVPDPITTAVKQVIPSTNTTTCSHNRGAEDKQTDEDCKQMDEKMFNQRLKIHKRTHTGDKPYKCDVCGKAFSQTGSLQRHMRRHTADKSYKCDVCGKTFIRRADLQRHMKIHTGVKPYKCVVCGKAFSRSGNLYTHMMTHTGDKPYQCDVCGLYHYIIL